MINRVLSFSKEDWIHIKFLAMNCIKGILTLDFKGAKESLIWIKIHLSYDSNKLD